MERNLYHSIMNYFFTILLGLFMTLPQAAFSETAKPKPIAILLLGPPGSGKGTQAVELSKVCKLPHISTGDLFREHLSKNTELGKQAKAYIDTGALVPDMLVLDILFDRERFD